MNIHKTDIQNEFKHIVKDSLIIGLCVVIIILLLLRGCGGKKGADQEPSVVYDTVYKNERLDTIYIPKPDIVFTPTHPRFKWDTIYLERLPDTIRVTEFESHPELWDYYSTRVYKDTLPHKYGKIILHDTVSQNMIQGRSVKTDLSIPEITRTITLIQPKRAAIFIGGGLFGNQKELAAGYNVNLSLKTKKDRMVEVGYNQFFGGHGYFSLGYKHKISLRK